MGRSTYSVIGYGMTLADARKDALERDLREHGHEQGYSGGFASSTGDDDRVVCLVAPVPAKRTIVERTPKGVPVKWETRYVAETFDGRRQVSEKTKGECVKKARALALATNERLYLSVAKVAVSGNTRFAQVLPGKAVMGQWRFSGEARS